MTEYLFRFDGARENDEFWQSVQQRRITNIYAGLEMQIGPGWVPDFASVLCDSSKQSCTLTLIELEASKPAALTSSRKYLPEDPQAILSAFDNYLQRVLSKCRSSSDPRATSFEDLRAFLRSARSITITAGCALRTNPDMLEQLPLINQSPTIEGGLRYGEEPNIVTTLPLVGSVSLTPRQTKAVHRAMVILDAVIRKKAHSSATLKNWTNLRTQPLRQAVLSSQQQFPELFRFLSFNKRSGISFPCEAIFAELAILWSDTAGRQFDCAEVRELIRNYFQVASALCKAEPMEDVFSGANHFVEVTPKALRFH